MERIKFATNLESRGTGGTLIMFETAKNNYNTVQLFSEINKSLFTCSIATMVYDMMPNYTDFTNFKDVYQGVNMANVSGGENYHTQNDTLANIEMSYLSQQAQIVDGLIDKLSNYDLELLHNADESAIFFSYLNIKTVVYNHTTSITVLTTHFACKWLKVEYRDMTRAFAYLHAVLGIVVSFVLADASYLFVFSGIMLMLNELVVTIFAKNDFEKYHGELLASALYLPIVIPVQVLAMTALGMTMAYVYGFVFALAIFGIGIGITPVCEYLSVRRVLGAKTSIVGIQW